MTREMPMIRDDIKFCEACDGKGHKKKACPDCEGTGREIFECPICGGAKEVSCKHCGSAHICPNCKGSGDVEDSCSNCGGRGDVLIDCVVCEGWGTIDTEDAPIQQEDGPHYVGYSDSK